MPRIFRLTSSESDAVSPVMPLLTPGRVRNASATRSMPWRWSSSVFSVFVNVLDCCSESLAPDRQFSR